MKELVKKVLTTAQDRKYRAVEVWLFRIAVAYVGVKLGVTFAEDVTP